MTEALLDAKEAQRRDELGAGGEDTHPQMHLPLHASSEHRVARFYRNIVEAV